MLPSLSLNVSFCPRFSPLFFQCMFLRVFKADFKINPLQEVILDWLIPKPSSVFLLVISHLIKSSLHTILSLLGLLAAFDAFGQSPLGILSSTGYRNRAFFFLPWPFSCFLACVLSPKRRGSPVICLSWADLFICSAWHLTQPLLCYLYCLQCSPHSSGKERDKEQTWTSTLCWDLPWEMPQGALVRAAAWCALASGESTAFVGEEKLS